MRMMVAERGISRHDCGVLLIFNEHKLWGAIDKLNTTMSKISESAAAQLETLEKISVSVNGIVADVKALNEKIAELQGSQGQISPEDQLLLDEVTRKSAELQVRLEQLDALTPIAPTPELA